MQMPGAVAGWLKVCFQFKGLGGVVAP